jgi:hypothetical protein
MLIYKNNINISFSYINIRFLLQFLKIGLIAINFHLILLKILVKIN